MQVPQPQAYCKRCGAKRPIAGLLVPKLTERGCVIFAGRCAECGAGVSSFVSSDLPDYEQLAGREVGPG